MRASPAYVQDENHHGGWVIILTAVGLVCLLLCLLIRLYVRWIYRSTLHTADAVLATAGLFAIVQSCVVFWEVSQGLGTGPKFLTTDTIATLKKANFASTVLYLFTVYLAKCCVAYVYLHLSPEVHLRRAVFVVLTLATVWILASTLMIGIDCALNQPWIDLASRCSDMFLRWQIITGLDITIEILLFCLSINLVAGTQMPLQKKTIVVTAFGIRLLVIIPTVLRLHFLDIGIHSTTPTIDAATTLIWTEIQMHFSVICSITYCFRSFTSAVSTNYGSVAINLDAYEETNGNLSAYTSSRKASASSRKPSKTPSNTNASLKSQRFTGHNGKYSTSTIITGGARGMTEPRKSGESTMVIIQEEIHVESSRATPTRELSGDDT